MALVAHELRTPLTASKGFVGSVLHYWDRLSDPERRELLERAARNQDELARLIDQLLEFTRLEAGRARVEPVAGLLGPCVEEVVEGLAPVLEDHDVHLDLSARHMVVADFDAIARVLGNLLTNAAKFSPGGSAIEIATADGDHEVIVAVSDEGMGIAPEDRERVFEPYYQAPGSELSRKGTGIGLSIARRLVEIHGGRIWVESRPKLGSRIVFTLPSAERAPATPATAAVV